MSRTLVARPETLHFNIGTLGAPAIAPVPGTPDLAAMDFFGQINIAQDKELEFSHIHLISGGAAGQALFLELYRRRDGVMTRLTQMSYTATGGESFITRGGVPAGQDRVSRAGDYIFCQAVLGTTGAPGDGLTVDMHFLFADGYL